MKPVVRLHGADADVRAVGREAVQALRGAEDAPALFAAVGDLHRRRRQQVSARASSAPAARKTPNADRVSPAHSRAWRVVWSSLVAAGLLAALVLAVEFGPADRKNAFSDPRLSVGIALVAAAAAGLLLLVAALLPVPDARSGAVGGLSAALIAVITGGILLYRLVVGVGDRRGLPAEALRWWIPVTAAILVLLIIVALRGEFARRRGRALTPPASTAEPDGADAPVRDLRRTAESIAATKPSPAQQQDWQRRLDRLAEAGTSPETIAQAKALTPAAWLAWMGYDGEIEIRSVLPRI